MFDWCQSCDAIFTDDDINETFRPGYCAPCSAGGDEVAGHGRSWVRTKTAAAARGFASYYRNCNLAPAFLVLNVPHAERPKYDWVVVETTPDHPDAIIDFEPIIVAL